MSFEVQHQLEPWLCGMLGEVEPVRRAVFHALELAGEDSERWAFGLSDTEMFARPAGLPSVAFQLRHIVRSLDRLLTYAEAVPSGAEAPIPLRESTCTAEAVPLQSSTLVDKPILSEAQLTALGTEMDAGTAEEVVAEFRTGLVSAVLPVSFGETRFVGREQLPTTLVGLLIHCADHTQRHVGQMVTTAKVIQAYPMG